MTEQQKIDKKTNDLMANNQIQIPLTIETLAQDISQMRNTLVKFVQALKVLDSRIKKLEKEYTLAQGKAERLTALERLQMSNNTNRTIKAEPTAIALTAHLLSKGATITMIIDSGLLTYSKAFAVGQWDRQHLHDFCLVNGVADILYDGLAPNQAQELMTITREIKPFFKIA